MDAAIASFSYALSQTAERVPVLDQSIVYSYRGTAHAFKGDYERAIADYNRPISIKPDHAESY